MSWLGGPLPELGTPQVEFDPDYSDFYDQGGWTETIIGPDMSEEIYRGTVGDARWRSDFSDGLDFLNNFTGNGSSDREPTNLSTTKAGYGLPSDKTRGAWIQPLTASVSQNYTGNPYGLSGYSTGAGGSALTGALGSTMRYAGQAPSLQNVIGRGVQSAATNMILNAGLSAIPGVGPALAIANAAGVDLPGAVQGGMRFAGDALKGGVGLVTDAFKGVGDFIGGIFCDEGLKVDIAPLESTEVNDELAQMAFFVKGLRECS